MATTLAERMNKFSGSPTSALIAKVAELKRQGKDIISLNVGEPDFGTPDYIKVAGMKAIADNFTKYTPGNGILELRQEIVKKLKAHNVEIRGDERACTVSKEIIPASEEDWGTEYLDAVISVKTVDSLREAIDHINRYNTGHSESIITKDYANALQFQDEIDAAAVYVNASTRFTDGFEFGFGAEIGISTQKLHARGPMGLNALTTTKYIIFGNGQIRK